MARVENEVSFLFKMKDQITRQVRNLARALGVLRKALGLVRKAFQLAFAATGVGIAFQAIVSGAFALSLRSSAQEMDRLAKASRRLGVSVGNLQALGLAAEYSGLEVKTLETALQRLNRRVSAASAGTGEALGALAALNLDPQQLRRLDPYERLAQTLEALREVQNVADRTRFAQALFDTEGVALMEVSVATLRSARDVLRDFNIELTQSDITPIEEMNDRFTTLWRVLGGFKNLLAVQVAPAIRDFVQEILDLLQSVNLRKYAENLVKAMHLAFTELKNAARDVWTIIASGASVAFNSIKMGIAEIGGALQQLGLFKGRDFSKMAREAFVGLKGDPLNEANPTYGSLDTFNNARRMLRRRLFGEEQYDMEGLFPALMRLLNPLNAGIAPAQGGGSESPDAATENIRRTWRDLLDDMREPVLALAETMKSSIGGAFDSIVDGTFRMRDFMRQLSRDIGRLFFQRSVSRLIGEAGAGGTAGTGLLGLLYPNALGNAFSRGNVVPFANGGVVTGPTFFPMSRGRTGLMGEAGEEAVMPLDRMAGGKLGINARGMGGMTVIQQIAISTLDPVTFGAYMVTPEGERAFRQLSTRAQQRRF